MLKYRRPINYQNNTYSEFILPKFDTSPFNPQTGLGTRDVSSLSQTSTISVRRGGKMVSQETVKVAKKAHRNTVQLTAQVITPIEVMKDGGIVIILPGNLIQISMADGIGVFNGMHFDVLPDQYRVLSQ